MSTIVEVPFKQIFDANQVGDWDKTTSDYPSFREAKIAYRAWVNDQLKMFLVNPPYRSTFKRGAPLPEPHYECETIRRHRADGTYYDESSSLGGSKRFTDASLPEGSDMHIRMGSDTYENLID